MNTQPRSTGRSAGVTQREFQSLRSEIITRFDDLGKQIQTMLPREIYEVRQRQVVDDMEDLRGRLAKLETSNIDLNTQLLSVRQVTPAQISKSAGDLRYETLARMFDLFAKTAFFLGGAVVTYLVYHH